MTRLTSLENALHDDRDGVARDQVCEMLHAAEQQLRQRMCQPATPAHHQAMAAQRAACQSAVQVIERLWQRYHGGRDARYPP
ncbi:MAG: EscE/YscE/SsaE family type III secretion system needle protein co-chaperone [Microvirgula sp.]